MAAIDPALADTAAFCEDYGVSLEESANCVVLAARRGGETRHAACMVPATTRADVNGLARRHLDARKASFAPMDEASADRHGVRRHHPGRPARGLADPGRPRRGRRPPRW